MIGSKYLEQVDPAFSTPIYLPIDFRWSAVLLYRYVQYLLANTVFLGSERILQHWGCALGRLGPPACRRQSRMELHLVASSHHADNIKGPHRPLVSKGNSTRDVINWIEYARPIALRPPDIKGTRHFGYTVFTLPAHRYPMFRNGLLLINENFAYLLWSLMICRS